jgi:hypothetical protein
VHSVQWLSTREPELKSVNESNQIKSKSHRRVGLEEIVQVPNRHFRSSF